LRYTPHAGFHRQLPGLRPDCCYALVRRGHLSPPVMYSVGWSRPPTCCGLLRCSLVRILSFSNASSLFIFTLLVPSAWSITRPVRVYGQPPNVGSVVLELYLDFSTQPTVHSFACCLSPESTTWVYPPAADGTTPGLKRTEQVLACVSPV
jgi:hypothetical protein